jgi:hypothetical protein
MIPGVEVKFVDGLGKQQPRKERCEVTRRKCASVNRVTIVIKLIDDSVVEDRVASDKDKVQTSTCTSTADPIYQKTDDTAPPERVEDRIVSDMTIHK